MTVYISEWLVLGPIFNRFHQSPPHNDKDGHPKAKEIIGEIDEALFTQINPAKSIYDAPENGDIFEYESDIYGRKKCRWKLVKFPTEWNDAKDVGDNIHKISEGFSGKHHALAFFLVYIESLREGKETDLCVRSDDSIRVWLNGSELEKLAHRGERDIPHEKICSRIKFNSGYNILMVAVAETHVEWGFSVEISNSENLKFTTKKPLESPTQKKSSGGAIMERVSVNGFLVPKDPNTVTAGKYLGHFLRISYIQKIDGESVYSKDRVDVEENGAFRFFIPKQDLITDEMVTIEVYAPNGELLGKQIYSYGSLKASIPKNTDDNTPALQIDVNPKVISFGKLEQRTEYRKINGKVIDLSGRKKAAGLQLIIMVSNNPNTTFDNENYTPIFSAVTDREGYFFGQVEENKTHQQAYGVIAGLEMHPVAIPLEEKQSQDTIEKKLPQNIILVADLSDLSDEFANNAGFSQDIGGKCVDFTVPNRTLEEFSFYHTVRTTEPEIRGLTITTKESQKIKDELFTISDELFTQLERLNSSFNTLSLIPYTTEEDKGEMENVPSSSQSYLLERRKEKLLALHRKLAAAYCGKHGVQQKKSYCETLTLKDENGSNPCQRKSKNVLVTVLVVSLTVLWEESLGKNLLPSRLKSGN